MLVRFLLVFALAALPAASSAQVSTGPAPASVRTDTILEVRLRGGSVIIGRVIEETPERVVVITAGGTRMELERAQIESIRRARGRVVNGRFWGEDPNITRLFFTSTARPVGKGEGYLSSFMLFFPFVAYGVTDRFTMAGGTMILPGAMFEVLYLAPKYTVLKGPSSALAVGALGFAFTKHLNEGSVGILYGASTWGSTDHAITAGAGWGYALGTSNSGLSSDPVFMVGGETRVGARVKLLTENWIFIGSGESGALVSGGLRFIGDRLSADLGFGGFVGAQDSGCCLPLVNFVYNFGHRTR